MDIVWIRSLWQISIIFQWINRPTFCQKTFIKGKMQRRNFSWWNGFRKNCNDGFVNCNSWTTFTNKEKSRKKFDHPSLNTFVTVGIWNSKSYKRTKNSHLLFVRKKKIWKKFTELRCGFDNLRNSFKWIFKRSSYQQDRCLPLFLVQNHFRWSSLHQRKNYSNI